MMHWACSYISIKAIYTSSPMQQKQKQALCKFLFHHAMQVKDHLESGLIPTWEAAPCIGRFKLCYSHVLLLPIELIHTINKKKKKMCCEYAASFIQMNLRLQKKRWLPSVESMHLIIQSSLECNRESSLTKRKHLTEANDEDLIFRHIGDLHGLQHLMQVISQIHDSERLQS